MSEEDSKIWSSYLSKHGQSFDSFDYDFSVGTGITPNQDVPEKFKKDYEDLTKKRIDCLGHNGNTVSIFEVKQRAGLSALGQLIGYKDLFEIDHPYLKVISLNLVCSSISDDEQKIYQNNGINVFEYPQT